MRYDEYEDDDYFEDFEESVLMFMNKMILNKIFSQMPKEFTYDEFAKSFLKTFKKSGMSELDLIKAFKISLDLELIEQISSKNEDSKFIFKGILIQTNDYN